MNRKIRKEKEEVVCVLWWQLKRRKEKEEEKKRRLEKRHGVVEGCLDESGSATRLFYISPFLYSPLRSAPLNLHGRPSQVHHPFRRQDRRWCLEGDRRRRSPPPPRRRRLRRRKCRHRQRHRPRGLRGYYPGGFPHQGRRRQRGRRERGSAPFFFLSPLSSPSSRPRRLLLLRWALWKRRCARQFGSQREEKGRGGTCGQGHASETEEDDQESRVRCQVSGTQTGTYPFNVVF